MKFQTTNNGTRGKANFYLRNNETNKISNTESLHLSHGAGDFDRFKKIMELDTSGTIKRAWNNFKQNIGVEIEIPHETYVKLKNAGLLRLGFGKTKAMN